MTALAADTPGVRADQKHGVFLSFTGQFHEEGGVVFATCDHAGIVTHGATREEALQRMPRAIALYVRTLVERGEFELAVRTGKLRVRWVEVEPQGWDAPRLTTVDDGFLAELAAA
jgi:predicted RNase H-like HicB family nuclease